MHRQPKRGDVKTTDGVLLEVASQACGDILMTDLRIQAAYDAWVEAHDLARLERQFLVWRTPQAMAKFQAAVWAGPLTNEDGVEVEVDAVNAVLQGMGVPWPWVSPYLLTNLFPVHYANTYARTVGSAKEIKMVGRPEMVPTAKKGRQPTAEAIESLRRHVGYWYAHKIKSPRDSIPELEKRERARIGQEWASSRHSTVIQGIQRAESLLSVWDRYELGLAFRSVDMEL
jgi:hypothetical protein